jgi:hypothetical protein
VVEKLAMFSMSGKNYPDLAWLLVQVRVVVRIFLPSSRFKRIADAEGYGLGTNAPTIGYH